MDDDSLNMLFHQLISSQPVPSFILFRVEIILLITCSISWPHESQSSHKYGLNSRTASCSYKLWPAVHQSIDWGIDWERRRERGHDDKEKGGYRQTTIPCYYYFYWNIYFNSIKQIVVGGGGWAELDNGCDWWRFCQLINRPQTHDPLAKILLL